MADRYDLDRNRDREREGRDWDRNREWDRGRDWGRETGGDRSAGRREDWDWDRRREFAGEAPRGGHEGSRWSGEGNQWGNEERWRNQERPQGERWGNERDYDRERGRGGDEGWRDARYSGSERVSQYGNRGDWGPQGNWGSFGNRSDYNRENTMREDHGLHPARVESDWGGQNTSRTNLFGTGGGGFGTGMASYGAGMGNFGGSASYGGGMGSERGRYSGRGPKGWQRSDDRIREDVNERLTDHPHIDASEIDVKVQNGEVTLTGTVDERQAKRLAEDIAESVSGVREVHNQIRVQQGDMASQGMASQGMGPSRVAEQRGPTSTQTRSK
jgi:hypothetical protein